MGQTIPSGSAQSATGRGQWCCFLGLWVCMFRNKGRHSNVCDARNSETASLKNVDKLPKIFKIHETLTLMETLERVRPIERKCSISALPNTRALLDSTALEQMQTN